MCQNYEHRQRPPLIEQVVGDTNTFFFFYSVMAWIEGRPYPKIVRSYMDGTNMETVISNSTHAIVTPMDIAIDSSGKHVYCSNLNVYLSLIIFCLICDTH